ncbi:hypothetical protein PIB30_072932 [Stylosanthes scabra]|uniref:Uncharacterized protein n=1 Tax=Stylosanthes scabra TaxID=79078 RepID=A0ABU6XM36_9FABA|nr:hypothetical protein [Stylosanthes scabra]
MAQGHVWSTLETWPKRDSLRTPSQNHVWTKFQTWPKRGSPNPIPRLAKFQPSVNGNKDKQILNFDPKIEWTLRKLRK